MLRKYRNQKRTMLLLNYQNYFMGFTLVEIMLGMVILVMAIVPVATLMTSNIKETNVGEIYSDMMHQSTRILDTLVEYAKYQDIIKAAYDTNTTSTAAVQILDLTKIIDSASTTPNKPIFEGELKSTTDTPSDGVNYGRSWKYADEMRLSSPIRYSLIVEQMSKKFRYFENKVDANGVSTALPNPTNAADIKTITVQGKLMKLTLVVEWGPVGKEKLYSLTTFKANLDN